IGSWWLRSSSLRLRAPRSPTPCRRRSSSPTAPVSFFRDEQLGYLATRPGELYHTVDGGLTWDLFWTAPFPESPLTHVRFVSEDAEGLLNAVAEAGKKRVVQLGRLGWQDPDLDEVGERRATGVDLLHPVARLDHLAGEPAAERGIPVGNGAEGADREVLVEALV